jgi:hypothetical protein
VTRDLMEAKAAAEEARKKWWRELSDGDAYLQTLRMFSRIDFVDGYLAALAASRARLLTELRNATNRPDPCTYICRRIAEIEQEETK